MNDHPTTKPVDESWVAHVRELSSGIEPPTPANPHAMSRVAVRRTRTRRAVLVSGGGLTAVAAVAATAFALGGPPAPDVLLPGAAMSASADPSTSAEEERTRRAEELRDTAGKAPASTSDGVPAGWNVHELEGLTYALPPEIVTSGPVQDEPGETSDMWHSSEDPDSPPFLRIAYVTPDYEFYDTKAAGLTQTPGAEARPFDLPGSTVATIEDGADLSVIAGARPDSAGEFVRILVHRADGPGRYIITMTLRDAGEADKEFVEQFQASLSLG
jgi:hypothetical protein